MNLEALKKNWVYLALFILIVFVNVMPRLADKGKAPAL